MPPRRFTVLGHGFPPISPPAAAKMTNLVFASQLDCDVFMPTGTQLPRYVAWLKLLPIHLWPTSAFHWAWLFGPLRIWDSCLIDWCGISSPLFAVRQLACAGTWSWNKLAGFKPGPSQTICFASCIRTVYGLTTALCWVICMHGPSITHIHNASQLQKRIAVLVNQCSPQRPLIEIPLSFYVERNQFNYCTHKTKFEQLLWEIFHQCSRRP